MKSSRLTRAHFLRGCSAAIAGLAGARLSRLALAAPAAQDTAPDVLVVVFLRGGWDGLNVVAPRSGDDRALYEAARPAIKLPVSGANALLPLDDRFGLHPALAPLFDLYQARNLAVIHAVGLDWDTRSHFDAMEFIELGTPGKKNSAAGWLTRHLQSAPPPSDPAQMPVVAAPSQPTALFGNTTAVSMNSIADLSQWDYGYVAQQQRALRALYAGESVMQRVGQHTLEALELARRLQEQTYQPEHGAVYADDELGRQFGMLAQLIKAGVGLKAAPVDFGGWDTHAYQTDDQGGGYMADLLGQLAAALANFYLDLDGAGERNFTRRLSLVVLSEFGRRLAQNESQGTDHGHGGVLLALGGGVNGGQVFGDWPGLANEQLYDRADLAVTTDYRRVLSELLTTRLANPQIETVFPGYTYAGPLGIFTV